MPLLLCMGTAASAGSIGDGLGPNLVVNGGFDTGLSGWTLESHSNFTSTWLSIEDVDGSLQSGVLRGEGLYGDPPPYHHIAWQCVSVTPGARYQLGGALKVPGDDEDNGHGRIVLFPAGPSGCVNVGAALAEVAPPAILGWQRRYTSVQIPAGMDRVQVATIADRGHTPDGTRLDPHKENVVLFDAIELREQLADLEVAFVAPTPYAAASNQPIEVKIHLRNGGQATATDPAVVFSHFGNLQLEDSSCIGAVTAIGGGRLRWSGFQLSAGVDTHCTLGMRVNPTFVGDLLLRAEASATSEGDASDNLVERTITVTGVPDIAVGLVAGPEFARPGALIDATLTLENVGTAFGIAAVALDFSLPLALESSSCALLEQSGSNRVAGSVLVQPGDAVECLLELRVPADATQQLLAFGAEADASGDSVHGNDSAEAAVRIVRLRATTTGDGYDRTPGDGLCEQTAGSGDCTLRGAVMESSALAGRWMVELPFFESPYLLERTSGGDSAQYYGDVEILDAMTVRGLPAADGRRPVVQGAFPTANPSRLFTVAHDSPAGRVVVIEDLVLAGQGLALAADDRGGNGGLLHQASGELTLRDVVLRNGRSAGVGNGGALYGTDWLTLDRVELHDNSARLGAALALDIVDVALVRIEDSHFHDNSTPALGAGGAMWIRAPLAFVSVLGTTMHGNQARNGGAMAVEQSPGLLIRNSTLSGNIANNAGGALFLSESEVAVSSSTIVHNDAAPGNPNAGQGGGIWRDATSSATLHNSILAYNSAQVTSGGLVQPIGGNCYPGVASTGYNTFTAGALDFSCAITTVLGSGPDTQNGAPVLGALAMNGGSTPTHALLSPGDEVDLGDPECRSGSGGPVLSLDQRGALRPADGDGDGDARCDKGAYELSDSARITVAKVGGGSGTVNSTPFAIGCGPVCTALFAFESEVTLTASAAVGSTFVGWSGACAGFVTSACTLTAAGEQSVEAQFEQVPTSHALTVVLGPSGNGSVASEPSGINCPGTCTAAFGHGAEVVLRAQPASDSVFLGFFGAGCNGSSDDCTIAMHDDRVVEAVFDVDSAELTVTLHGNGVGRVRSTPAGIDCPGDCQQVYAATASVTLAAEPAVGSVFSGWSGSCQGSASCELDMDLGPHAVEANFEATAEQLFSDGFESP